MANDLGEAFGSFDPQHNEDAAVKFMLALLVTGRALDRLTALLPTAASGGIGGDSGWVLEHRHPDSLVATEYASWPHGAEYRRYVDPDAC